MKKSYAITDESRIRKAKKIVSCIEYITNKKLEHKIILEIGGGSGIISYEIAKYGNNVITIDIQCADMKNAISRYDIDSDIFNFLMASGVQLPFKSDYFDIVICNHIIEHIPKKCHLHLINESYRVLRSNGVFYIATPNKLWPIECHTKLPLLSYLPRNIQSIYARLFRGIDTYDVELLTYRQFRKIILDTFKNIHDMHSEIIRRPEMFNMGEDIPKFMAKLTPLIPKRLADNLSDIIPSWIIIAIKE